MRYPGEQCVLFEKQSNILASHDTRPRARSSIGIRELKLVSKAHCCAVELRCALPVSLATSGAFDSP
jgi:hypothetical protein